MVAYSDHSAGNDSKLFFFFFGGGGGGGGSLSPPRLNNFTVGNMGVMICLGQGGLHSLSASSFKIEFVHYSDCLFVSWHLYVHLYLHTELGQRLNVAMA